MKESTDGKKNTFTFIVGATIHVAIFVSLEWYHKSYKNAFVSILHNFYMYFVIIDVLAMVAIYKLYWNRGILNEFDGDPDGWTLDENHRYHRKPSPPDEVTSVKQDLSSINHFSQMTSLNETQKQQIDDILSKATSTREENVVAQEKDEPLSRDKDTKIEEPLSSREKEEKPSLSRDREEKTEEPISSRDKEEKDDHVDAP